MLTSGMSFIKKLIHALLAPFHCASCKIMMEHDFPLCEPCRAVIRLLLPTELQITSTKKMTVFALGAYEGALAQLVRAKQYRSISAAQQLGQLLADQVQTWNMPIDYVVPVPLHWRRYAWRGYNQAEVMAQVIAQMRKVPVMKSLKRTRYTAYQMTQSAHGRIQNVLNVFSVGEDALEKYTGKHMVIVDDLMTTGATLEAVARALLPLKPASITALVGCRVV